MAPIKNIIFDVGNVLVKWQPQNVIQRVLPETDPKKFFDEIRPIWLDLNLGKLTEAQAINILHKQLNLPEKQLGQLLLGLKVHQTPIAGSIALLKKLKLAKYNLYAITDNIKEIIAFHHNNSDFLRFFIDVIVSADLGILKPSPDIYLHLLNKYHLNPTKTVFIDDVPQNIEGAKKVGMHGILFTNTKACETELIRLGIQF